MIGEIDILKKILSVLRWVGVMLISLLGWVTAKFMFPIAYLLRNIPIVRNKLLWIYYDDEDGYGYNVDWWMANPHKTYIKVWKWVLIDWETPKKKDFRTAYKWCALRNSAWNLQSILKPKQGLKQYVSYKGSISQNGNYDISIYKMCVLKYVNKLGEYQDNKGEYLSLKHSIIGSMFVWYNVNNKLYWRYSFAKKVLSLWCEIQLGTNDRRYTFRLKIKKVKTL